MASLGDKLPHDPATVHHATLVTGADADTIGELDQYLTDSLGIDRRDMYRFGTGEEPISIDDARAIRRDQAQKPVAGSRTIFVLDARAGIRTEAQHALLKVFEDPAPSTTFIVLLPSHPRLLDTIRSRAAIITLDHAASERVYTDMANTFLAGRPAERLELVKDIITAKDRAQLSALLDDIELIVAQQWRQAGYDAAYENALLIIDDVKRYIGDTGSSPKVLAEHLAITLPVIQPRS